MANINVLGYTFDAIFEAIKLATTAGEDGKVPQVTFLATAPIGSPMDEYEDLISARYADMLNALLGGLVEWTEYLNPRFYYVPFDMLKIENKSNGVMQYPFSKKSFANEDEWKEICTAYSSKAVQDIATNMTLSPSKLVTALKNYMPQKFVDSFIKAIPSIRWRGMQLSSFSMYGFLYEFSLEHLLDAKYNECYCRPNMTYRQIGEALLDRFGISYRYVDEDEARSLILERNVTDELVVFDNRVDQYMNYVGGRFDRFKIWSVPIKVPPQLSYSGNGLFYTPMSECWGVTIFDGNAKRLMAKPITTLFDKGTSEIPSSKANIKLVGQYASLITHYGNKKFKWGQGIETLIK